MRSKAFFLSISILLYSNISGQISAAKTATITYIIPVVFHILHENGPENISDAQVLDAMRILNEDFQMRNADTSDIVPAFKNIKASMDVEFRLAKLDPNGHCTNGIEHIQSPLTFYGGDTAKINQWDPTKYLNIWVVKQLINAGQAGNYCSPSQAAANPAIDGVIIVSSYVGSIGTSSSFTSRGITQLVGRNLNLLHPCGCMGTVGVTCGDDGVSDTPVTKGWLNCNNLNGSVCNPPIIENVQNFMEYSYCSRMFTLGQTAVVHNCLNSTLAGRNNLWQPANLLATGTDNASFSSTVSCAPAAGFNANRRYICEGSSVIFSDASYRGTPSSWYWELPGGTPSVSTASMQTVTYNVSGTYPVKLKVSNSSGSDSLVQTGYITVRQPTAPNPSTVSESFESIAIPGNNWLVNPGFDLHTWQIANTGATGSKSAWIDNYNSAAYDIDELISPSFYLLYGMSNVTLTFKVAYAQQVISTDNSPGKNGYLMVYVSKDCGATWGNVYLKSGGSLATTTMNVTNAFVPTASQWRTETVTLPPAYTGHNTMLKFVYTGATIDNNIYIDDININSILSVNELEQSTAVEVIPNPFSNEATIHISTTKEEAVRLELKDLLGHTVAVVPGNRLMAGDNTFTLHADNLAKGLYLLDISSESGRITKKVLIQ